MGELIEKLNCCGGGPPKRTLQEINCERIEQLVCWCVSRGGLRYLFDFLASELFFWLVIGRKPAAGNQPREKTSGQGSKEMEQKAFQFVFFFN